MPEAPGSTQHGSRQCQECRHQQIHGAGNLGLEPAVGLSHNNECGGHPPHASAIPPSAQANQNHHDVKDFRVFLHASPAVILKVPDARGRPPESAFRAVLEG